MLYSTLAKGGIFCYERWHLSHQKMACFATKDVVPQKRYMILAFFDKEMKLEKSIILVLNNEDKVISLPFFSQGPLTPKMLMETIMKYTDSQNNPSILNQAEAK